MLLQHGLSVQQIHEQPLCVRDPCNDQTLTCNLFGLAAAFGDLSLLDCLLAAPGAAEALQEHGGPQWTQCRVAHIMHSSNSVMPLLWHSLGVAAAYLHNPPDARAAALFNVRRCQCFERLVRQCGISSEIMEVVVDSLELQVFYEAGTVPAPLSPEVEEGLETYWTFLLALKPCQHCALWGTGPCARAASRRAAS